MKVSELKDKLDQYSDDDNVIIVDDGSNDYDIDSLSSDGVDTVFILQGVEL